MVPCWFVTPCRQEMRGTFVIFLLTAVKNIRKKKRWSGNSWTSKTAQKISQKANLQFLFSIFFSFQPNRKKKTRTQWWRVQDLPWAFFFSPPTLSVSHILTTTIPLFILLCTSIHLPSTAPSSSSSSSHSSANPPCSSSFSLSNHVSLRYLLLLHLPPFPFFCRNLICPISDFDPKSLFDHFARPFTSLLLLGHSLFFVLEIFLALIN